MISIHMHTKYKSLQIRELKSEEFKRIKLVEHDFTAEFIQLETIKRFMTKYHCKNTIFNIMIDPTNAVF